MVGGSEVLVPCVLGVVVVLAPARGGLERLVALAVPLGLLGARLLPLRLGPRPFRLVAAGSTPIRQRAAPASASPIGST